MGHLLPNLLGAVTHWIRFVSLNPTYAVMVKLMTKEKVVRTLSFEPTPPPPPPWWKFLYRHTSKIRNFIKDGMTVKQWNILKSKRKSKKKRKKREKAIDSSYHTQGLMRSRHLQMAQILFTTLASFHRLRDWNALTESVIADDSITKFTSQLRARD